MKAGEFPVNKDKGGQGEEGGKMKEVRGQEDCSGNRGLDSLQASFIPLNVSEKKEDGRARGGEVEEKKRKGEGRPEQR